MERELVVRGLPFNGCHAVHGYSGGPLLQPVIGTDRFEVLGVNVAISTANGAPMTFAVPAVTVVREGDSRRIAATSPLSAGIFCPLACGYARYVA
jgi:hypothetical protein